MYLTCLRVTSKTEHISDHTYTDRPLESLNFFFVAPHHFYLSTPVVDPILCLQWYKKYLRLQMYCYTFVTLEYTCKINIYDFKFTVTLVYAFKF